MPEDPSDPQKGRFDQPGWKVDNVTQIAQQTVYNINQAGETQLQAGQPRAFFTVPFPRNADFVGREADLTTLHAALSGDGPVGILPAGLTGQGGMGKTALAVEYCHRQREDYPGGVFWVNAAEPLAQGFASLGCLIDPANFDRPIPRQIDAAAHYLTSHPDALLVLDNVEDPALLNRPVATGLIPAHLPCRVLFTTRRRDLPARCSPVEVTVLPETAALSLLLRHPERQLAQQPNHAEYAEAWRICRRLGYLPLALEIAGAFLGEWLEIGLADFRARLEGEGTLATLDEEQGYLSPANLPAIHRAGLGAVLATQWETLDNADAKLLLRVAGQLPEAAQIPTARLGLLAGLDGDERPGRPSRLQRALRRLDALSLVEELRGDEVRLHPLVREFAAAQTPTSERDDFRAACAENLYRAYSDFAALESQCVRRGVTSLEVDLRTALYLLADPQSPVFQSLNSLQRILERESHVLRDWEAARHPALFVQQIWYRAILDQEKRLLANTILRLTELAQSYLLLTWAIRQPSQGLIRVLIGHESWILSVVVTPDSRKAVSASYDGTVRVWDMGSGAEERLLVGHTGGVNAVAVTPDGRRAISAGEDRTLRVWNLENGAEEQVLIGHTDGVNAVAVTPDGKRAVSASTDRTLRVWNLVNGTTEKIMAEHQSWVRTVALTPDGRKVISASLDEAIRIWNLETDDVATVLIGHTSSVQAVTVTPDGRWGVSASSDFTIRVWDLKSGTIERVLGSHKSSVQSLAISKDGKRLVSSSEDGSLWIWDLGNGVLEKKWKGHESSIESLAITDNGHRVVSASRDRTLKVWSISTLHKVRETNSLAEHILLRVYEAGILSIPVKAHEASVLSIAVTKDQKHAVSIAEDRTLRSWDLVSGEQRLILSDYATLTRWVTVTLDGKRAISRLTDGSLEIWDLESGEKVSKLPRHKSFVHSVAISEDGTLAVSASSDGAIRVWELKHKRIVLTLTGHEASVASVVMTFDGKRALSASNDWTLRVWNLQNGTQERVLTGHEDHVNAVAVTPDGRRAVSASHDRTLRVWDLQTGAEERVLTGHKDSVNAVAVTPDGRRAVSASDDRTLRVWDLESGEELAMIVLDGALQAVAVAPNGTTIVAGDAGGNVYCLEYVE